MASWREAMMVRAGVCLSHYICTQEAKGEQEVRAGYRVLKPTTNHLLLTARLYILSIP